MPAGRYSHHPQAHGDAKTNLLRLVHLQFPRDQPRETGEDEVHDDVVDCTAQSVMSRWRSHLQLTVPALLVIIARLLVKANVKPPRDIIAFVAAHLGPLKHHLDDHVAVHGYDAEPQN